MKKRRIGLLPALLLSAVMVLSACSQVGFVSASSTVNAATAPSTPPPSQPSSWAAESVARARELELVTDEVNSSFQSATTRAEFSRLAMNFIEVLTGLESEVIFNNFPEEEQAAATFNDTNDVAIRTAAVFGILNGTGNGNFTPDRALTRQEAATMLRNTVVVLLSGDPLDVIPELQGLQPIAWTDEAQISSWARGATDVVFALGIMGGTSSTDLVFAPQSTFTREQAIVTFLNLWDWVQTTPLVEYWGRWNDGTNTDEMPATTQAISPNTAQVTQPATPSRQFNMNDPNVQLIPNFANARTPEELRSLEERRLGVANGGWQNAAEVIERAQRDHPDYLIDGRTAYEWRHSPIIAWVNNYLAVSDIDISDMTDYEKTAVIRRFIEEGNLETFIGLWRPNFRFTSGDCVPRAEALNFLMMAMGFQLYRNVSTLHGSTAHAMNAYWDSTVGAIRFIDADPMANVWNLFVDELHERRFTLVNRGN